LKGLQAEIYKFQQGGGQPHVYPKDLVNIEIPLPPLEVQEQIVAELDGYAAIISGAKQIVENWKPRIDVDSEWPQYSLGQLVSIDKQQANHEGLPFVGLEDIESNSGRFLGKLQPKKVKSSTDFV
jgi:type I restriction enzyme M protein